MPRRPLLLILLVFSTFLTLGLARVPSLPAFNALTFLVGVSTVTPQVLIPLAADLAPPARRGTAIAIVLSGLLLGLMVARVLAGIIAQFTGHNGDGWRNVYWMAFGVQVSVNPLLSLLARDRRQWSIGSVVERTLTIHRHSQEYYCTSFSQTGQPKTKAPDSHTSVS